MAVLTLPCSLPMPWMGLPAPAKGEGAGQPGAALSGPRGTCHSQGLGLPASAGMTARNRAAPELGPFHQFFSSRSNRAAMRGLLPARMQSCTSLSDPGHERPPSPSLGKGWHSSAPLSRLPEWGDAGEGLAALSQRLPILLIRWCLPPSFSV